MKRYLKSAVILGMAVCLLFSSSYAQASQSEVDRLKQEADDASNTVNDIKNKQSKQKEASDALESQANELSGTISDLNTQISVVAGEINDAQDSIDTANADIETLNEQIETTQAQLDTQQESMKKRIQYMYENQSTNQLVSLLESGSISEFLQRLEYMSQITDYDQKAIESYAATRASLEETTAELEAKNQELEEYQDTLSAKTTELGTLVSNANTALNTTTEQLTTSKQLEAALEEQLAEAEAYEKKIQEQYQKAQVELAQKLAGESGGYTGGYSTTDEETLLLAALIQAEADNQGSDGRLAVGSVVMNRVNSSKFPNTIAGVIYANNQFAPVASGRVATILAQGPHSWCQKAAADAIAGNTNTDALFFCTYSYAQMLQETQTAAGQAGFLDRTSGTVINAHYFYNYN